MGQSAKLERQCLSKHANITFPLFIASKSQGTLRPQSPAPSLSNLHRFTINSQINNSQRALICITKPFLVNFTSRVSPSYS